MHKVRSILVLFLLSLMHACVAHAQGVQTNGPYGGMITSSAVSGTNLSAGVRAFAEAPVLVFEHANLIDGISDAPQRDVTVVVREGKIDVVSVARISSPANAKRFDLSGRWLLPGFIDAHTHPFNIKFARNMLAITGMTTSRSMFTGRYFDVELRERHRRGEFDIPDILAAGYPVVPNIGTFPIPDWANIAAIFEDHPQLKDLRGVADVGAAGVQRLVLANLDRKVDVIKVFATNRAFFLSMDPRGRALSNEQLVAAVAEAHNAGIPVAAHALGDEGVVAAVGAGVNSIEHGIYLTDATLELMKEKNAYFVPTISVYPPQGQTKRSNASDADAMVARRQDMAVSVRDSARRAHKMGLRVIAGTDGGGSIGGEIIELVGIGMTPMEAIQAATSRCAEALGISKRTGSIRPGMEADLIVLDANPLEDIKAVRDVVLVVNDGRVVAKIFYNGGFEFSVLPPWRTYGKVTTRVVTELAGATVPENVIEGKYCLFLDVAPDIADFWDAGLEHSGIAFEQGKKYTISAFLKSKKGDLQVNFKPQLAADPWTGYSEKMMTITEKWAEYSVTTPVFTADVRPASFVFHIGSAVGGFWVDGVRFYEGDYVPPAAGQ